MGKFQAVGTQLLELLHQCSTKL